MIILGDINTKLEHETEWIEDDLGFSGIGAVNERKLIKGCQINDFTITNTSLQKYVPVNVDAERSSLRSPPASGTRESRGQQVTRHLPLRAFHF
ncbi:hypothetical protein PoB_003828000 [Plakobranchus ocellatus]|uniref:Endonuclease/exonuclease/phosphatase domain-containing protein n=1 Tax=Plakobranchus ocellatus TaxID=259542 RepID=A0AAV4AY83_9GAST|nr:hypothetical protein PoB_003828000 [Plakobranchus ocellatus]